MEENNNLNNSNNANNDKIEIVDASLLNPFSSNIKNEKTLNVESNHDGVNSIEKTVNQNSTNVESPSQITNNQVVSEHINAEPIVNNHNSVDTKEVTPSLNEQHTNNMNYSVNNSIEIDDELLDAYIGPNAYKIKSQGLSWPTFWLGIYYALYRKMWLLAFAMFVVSFIATVFLPSLSTIISLSLGIFIFVSFNKMYVNHAREDIKRIIIQNPNASRSEILSICRVKGGTSIVPVIVYILVFMGLQFYVGIKAREEISARWDTALSDRDNK